MRAALSGQVLDSDNLAAHRIEAELRIVNALKVAKEELEVKAVELDEAEAEAADLAAYESDIARNEKFAEHAAAFEAAFAASTDAAKALWRDAEDFLLALSTPTRARVLAEFKNTLSAFISNCAKGYEAVERDLERHNAMLQVSRPKKRAASKQQAFYWRR